MLLERHTETSNLDDLPPMNVIFGKSHAMALALEKLERVAATDVPVLLQGESGTGKDILARLLHSRSLRSKSALVKVTCPAIPNALIESELFGYEKGSFTGAYATKLGRVEMADRGTLFLDEIGSLDLSVQAKLLQVVQDGSFMRVGARKSRRIDTRLISSANANLRRQTEVGSFRLDFFFRINAVTIDLPPLRERIEDLPMLVNCFIETHSKAFHRIPRPLSRETMRLMRRYNWPGNIRQLENMIRGYILMGNEESLAAELAPPLPSELIPSIDLDNPVSLKEITRAATKELEREIILKVLRANEWNRQKTARWLNISYRSLLYKLQDSDLRRLPGPRLRAKPPARASVSLEAAPGEAIKPVASVKTGAGFPISKAS